MNAERSDKGFTLVELMVVVLIIGILVAIAIPVFGAAKTNAQQKTCYGNQRTIEGAVEIWSAQHNQDILGAAGVVDKTHPFIGQYILRVPPMCPSAPHPDDPMDATAATGAYSIDLSGTVIPCAFGDPVHGSFD